MIRRSGAAIAISGFLLASGAAVAQQYVISTIAGGGTTPTPAPAVSVSVGTPFGVATDAPGNLYFSASDAVFKVDSTGTLTRVAGNSRPGDSGDGGPAINAQLRTFAPTFDDSEVYTGALAIDRPGNLYIADGYNGRVRKVSPSGIITTVAGGGACRDSCDGEPATSAQLFPTGLAVDSSGNLYVADALSQRIRVVSPSGILNTVAGNGTYGYSGDGGPATGAQLASPAGLAVDRAGNLYIADSANSRVRKVSTAGVITTVAGNGGYYSGDGGPATGAGLAWPLGLAFDGGDDLYIAEAGGHVRKVSADGTITTVAGFTAAVGGGPPGPCCVIGDGGPATSAQLSYLLGVAVDSAGQIYIADAYNSRIRKVSPSGIITTVAGNGSYENYYGYAGDGGIATGAQLKGVLGMAVDADGNLFVADSQHYSVRKVSPSGFITTVAGVGGSQGYSGDGGPAEKAQLGAPSALAFDRAGNLYIATTGNFRVRKVSPTGIIATVAGNGTYGSSGDGGPATAAQLGNPTGLAVDSAGNLYIEENFRVRKVSPDGIITTFAPTGSYRGLAIDSRGNLYFAGGGRVSMVSPAGLMTNVAGNGFTGYWGDGGPATDAQLDPSGIAIGQDGNLFVADGNRVRKISTDGIITTIAGDGTYGSSGDGQPALRAQLNRPQALAADSNGNVYVAEYNVVRLLEPVSSSLVISGVANAASKISGPICAGEIVDITGSGFGPTGTTVRINGILAPIIRTSATQITAIVPYSIYGDTARINVSYPGRTSDLFSVPLAFSSPGVFTLASSGRGQAASVHADGSTNSAANPARAGDIISLFATGEGQTSPAGADGGRTPAPEPHPVFPVSVTIGGRTLIPAYAGGAPGQVAGVMQINVAIPSGIPPGSAVPVVVQVGNTSSQAGVTIAVR